MGPRMHRQGGRLQTSENGTVRERRSPRNGSNYSLHRTALGDHLCAGGIDKNSVVGLSIARRRRKCFKSGLEWLLADAFVQNIEDSGDAWELGINFDNPFFSSRDKFCSNIVACN